MTACSSCVKRLELRNSSISEAGREGAVAARMRVADSSRSHYWSSWRWGSSGEESLSEEGAQAGAEWSSEKEGNYSIGLNIIIMMDFYRQNIVVAGGQLYDSCERSRESEQEGQQDEKREED